MAKVGLRFRATSFEPCFYFVFRRGGGALGTFATQIDDVRGRGEQDALTRILAFLEFRSGTTDAHGPAFAHVGMALPQGSELPVKLTQE